MDYRESFQVDYVVYDGRVVRCERSYEEFAEEASCFGGESSDVRMPSCARDMG